MHLKLLARPVALVALASALFAQSTPAENPSRLRRADSFLGIHFDFHAGPDCTEVGKRTTPAMIERIIDLVHPDYLQIDCKGHPGYSSYPTKVGNPAPGFVGDPLKVWREVTARRGVALYMHYSGVWDGNAVKHPGWAAIDADGKPNTKATSRWSAYADELLIPQLRELAGDYGVDGAWIDGDCWAAVPDYCDAAVKEFREQTGFADVPRKSGEPHWHEWLEFHRDAFRAYLNHNIAEVKRTNPAFQICSNWAFTDHMPEPVCAPVDFISGDYAPDNSVNSARLAGRFLPRQGKPWDLMAWSFSMKAAEKPGQKIQKTAVQLEREAAVVLALGGGFQAYFRQRRDGSIFDDEMPVMAEVAKFCRERQALCHHAEAVPQIALLLSTAAHYRMIDGVFSRNNGRIGGVLQALLESQQSVELLAEHHLAGRLAEYPLIVVPEWQYLDPRFKGELVAYARDGGNLLLIGPRTAALFETELGVKLQGNAKPNAALYLRRADGLAPVTGDRQAVRLGAQAAAVGEIFATNDPVASSQPAASITPFGRGRIAATYFSFGQSYNKEPNEAARDFLAALVRQLFPAPIVEVSGSHDVDVCVARNHGQLLVNLINTAGPHRTAPIIDSIPAVGPLTITVRSATKPAHITLEPGHRPLAAEFHDGKLEIKLPSLTIHDIIALAP